MARNKNVIGFEDVKYATRNDNYYVIHYNVTNKKRSSKTQ